MPEINPGVLKYGALGLMFVGLVLAGSIVFGAKDGAKPGQYRLLVTFMIFALVLVAAAVGSELFRTRAADQLAAEQAKSAALQSQVDTLTADAKDAAAKLTDAQKPRATFATVSQPSSTAPRRRSASSSSASTASGATR